MAPTTIGRLAEDLGVSIDTVRYYERRGLLLEPDRTEAGYRTYGAEDRWRLGFILRAKELGFTLREVADLLDQVTDRRGDPALAVRTAAAAKLADIAAQQRALDEVAGRLDGLVRLCDGGDVDGCAALGSACGA